MCMPIHILMDLWIILHYVHTYVLPKFVTAAMLGDACDLRGEKYKAVFFSKAEVLNHLFLSTLFRINKTTLKKD